MCEEQPPLQNSIANHPADHSQAPSSNETYRPTHSELPYGQQESHPTLFGPLTIDPFPPPNASTGQQPPTKTQGTAPSGVHECACSCMPTCPLPCLYRHHLVLHTAAIRTCADYQYYCAACPPPPCCGFSYCCWWFCSANGPLSTGDTATGHPSICPTTQGSQ